MNHRLTTATLSLLYFCFIGVGCVPYSDSENVASPSPPASAAQQTIEPQTQPPREAMQSPTQPPPPPARDGSAVRAEDQSTHRRISKEIAFVDGGLAEIRQPWDIFGLDSFAQILKMNDLIDNDLKANPEVVLTSDEISIRAKDMKQIERVFTSILHVLLSGSQPLRHELNA
jgi:hypothetical protein